MSFSYRGFVGACLICACIGGFSTSAVAGIVKVLIVHADNIPSADGTAAALMNTNLFGQVDLFNTSLPPASPSDVDGTGVPTLALLNQYDVVLAYTNFSPDNANALGDVLADYVDAGHGLVLATYGLGDMGLWGVGGRIVTSGYSPFVPSLITTDLSGSLVPEIGHGTDPIFAGVNLANLNYFHNSNFADPELDLNATLIATDGAGINVIARNQAGNIVGLNLFPGLGDGTNNGEFYSLLGNSLLSVISPAATVPEPATTILLLQAGLATVGIGVRRHIQRVRHSD